jgi:formylglycine-generating enzyme required for sulfatase activity
MSQAQPPEQQPSPMADNYPNQPGEYDAVLSSSPAPPSVGDVVLGGIEGFKRYWATATVEQRVTALSKALAFGEVGLDWVIQALWNESKQVRLAAYFLLKDCQEPRVKQQLWNYLPRFEFDVVRVNARGRVINRRRSHAQFFEEDLGNGVSLTMVLIPGGTFEMGLSEAEKRHSDRAIPQHRITVAPLFMSKYPITQAQWEAVAALPQVNYSLKRDPSYFNFNGKNRPVEQVSWDDAVEWCDRLALKTGRSYRLPSEAEWEYAARSGTTTPFHFGETITSDLANYNGNCFYASEARGTYRKQTTDVGSFPPNAFGLYDMHGLVWEWCANSWRWKYYLAPSDGRVWIDDKDNNFRPLRGGAWCYAPVFCRSAFRYSYLSGVRSSIIGFRVVVAYS